jgi:anti-sigma factor ChrR (cupin superfamily)
MRCSSIRSPTHAAKMLLVALLLSFCSVAAAQTGEASGGVDLTPVTSQVLPHDPGRSLTAVVVELAPGAKSASHRHAGIVFAYVLEGTVRSQLNGGEVMEYGAGKAGSSRPGPRTHSRRTPARPCLLVFSLCSSLRPGHY